MEYYPIFLFLQMDALSNGNSLNEVAHIANGSHPGNCISLLRINVRSLVKLKKKKKKLGCTLLDALGGI